MVGEGAEGQEEAVVRTEVGVVGRGDREVEAEGRPVQHLQQGGGEKAARQLSDEEQMGSGGG